MSNHEAIRVYLRLRPQISIQQSSILGTSSCDNAPCSYVLEPSFSGRSKLMFHVDRRSESDIVNNSLEDFSFQFRHIFEPQSTQEDVFNVVAKDCVLSVLDGYNSTIFAYGQTGSGKTYSITGGTESYDERGIIPRALGLIYDEVAKRQQDCFWSVCISYLQIYNDKGQDLLNRGQDAKTLEELPNVTVHETTTGSDDELMVVLRGLQQHAAPTLTEALNLLFLGDTNRLYCETPMNRTSSRSHCVFTISLEARVAGSSVIRRSKLNLVDLAGSERVSKSGVGGTILSEAKYINLSLHYLEHVIVALSEQAKGRRDHVPFRNSFLTMVLRDSLGGNCRTSMLATAHLSKAALPETISTCGFAQRVALIKQDARINEETDPVLLLKKLKAEVAQLRDQLAFYEKNGDGKGGGVDRDLTEEEKILCRNMVDAYIGGDSRIEGFEGEMVRIYYCFDLMKHRILGETSGVKNGLTGGPGSPLNSNANGSSHFSTSNNQGGREAVSGERLSATTKVYEEQIERLQISLKQKENEINTILDILHRTQGTRFNAATQTFGSVNQYYDSNSQMNDVRRESVGDFDHSSHTERQKHTDLPQQSAFSRKSADLLPAFDRLSDLAQQGKINSTEAAATEEYLRRKQQQPQDFSALSDAQLVEDRAAAFEAFKGSYQNYVKIETTKKDLKAAYVTCKETAQQLNQSVDTMKSLKQQIQRLRAERAVDGIEVVDSEEQNLMDQLGSTRQRYNTLAAELRQQRETIDGMHAFMKHSQEQVARDFEEWFKTRKKQVAMAVQSTRLDPSPKEVHNMTNNAASTTILNHLNSNDNVEVKHPSSAPTTVFHGTTHANSASVGSLATSDQPRSNALNNSSILFTESAPGTASNSKSNPITYGAPGAPPLSSTPGFPLSMWMMPALSNSTTPQIESTTTNSHSPLFLNTSASPSSPEVLHSSLRLHNGDGETSSHSTVPIFPNNTNPKPFHLQPLGPQVALPSQPSGTFPLPLGNKEPPPSTSSLLVTPLSGHASPHMLPINTNSLSSSYTAYSTQSNPYAPTHRSTGNKAADEQLAALYKLRDAMRQNMGNS